MAERQRAFSGVATEELAGYCRAIRVGNVIHVSGTTATNENNEVVGVGDMRAQADFILQKIEKALQQLGATRDDVVRTRIYITDASLWLPVSEAHGDFFRGIPPANTLVEVSALIGDDYLVEIEAEAIVT